MVASQTPRQEESEITNRSIISKSITSSGCGTFSFYVTLYDHIGVFFRCLTLLRIHVQVFESVTGSHANTLEWGCFIFGVQALNRDACDRH